MTIVCCQEEKESENLYNQAFEKYQKGNTTKPCTTGEA